MPYFAHSANRLGDWQSQSDHLRGTTLRLLQFAEVSGIQEEAELTGLLHDAGKYPQLFQDRLRGISRRVDHWSPGAWLALRDFHSIAAALAIQGHHVGLQRGDPDSLRAMSLDQLASHHPLGLTVSSTDVAELQRLLATDGVALPSVTEPLIPEVSDTIGPMVDVRTLYSALVDADFLDTEEHFSAGDRQRPAGLELQPERALRLLLTHMRSVRAGSTAAEEVAELRNDLFDSCLSAAGRQTGLWTLTAPTGAGKTLAMLAWALKHAQVNRLRRIVVVIPYLSIIEQTADIYRDIFEAELGPNYVLEHHSLAERDEGSDSGQARLLSENWDAPIVITTSIQALESLFSNRPRACRKLHRLARSAILFDEVQTLPADLATATLAALSHLSGRYGSSVVFATATQPAFDHLNEGVESLTGGASGWLPQEVVDQSLNLFDRSRRVTVRWPDLEERLSWADLAGQIATSEQALCVVNLKRHARELIEQLEVLGEEDVFHLSTAMCPEHRRQELTSVRSLLEDGAKCRLISTQCIEAGCDVSFPDVWRAFADLCSVAQASGRCNRSGEWGMREVRVFIPEDEAYPNSAYEQAAGVTRVLLNERGADRMDINDPELFRAYYLRLYDMTAPELRERATQIENAIRVQSYVDLARHYRLIHQDTVNVLVPYDADAYEELADEATCRGLSSDWIRRARPHSVALFRPRDASPVLERLQPVMVQSEESRDWFIYRDADRGHSDYTRRGLRLPDAPGMLIA